MALAPSAISSLPAAVQALLSPTLTAPAAGSTAPILDLMIASSDGTTPPVDVNLLDVDSGLEVLSGKAGVQ